MKKTLFVLACLCMSIVAKAQKVVPLNITLVEFSIDSLQTVHSDPNALLGELVSLLQQAKEDQTEIELAKNQIKSEKAYYKSYNKILKDRQKQLTSQEKGLRKELKIHEKDRKKIVKEQKSLREDHSLNGELLQKSLGAIDARLNRIRQAEEICQGKIMKLNEQFDKLKNEMIQLAEYQYQIQTKENKLDALETRAKLNVSILEHEIKNVKTRLK